MYFAVIRKRKILVVISLILLVGILSLNIFGSSAKTVFANRQLPIYRVKTEEKKVALSFDCAWGVDYTDKLLNVFSQEEIRVTFFMVEFWTSKHPDYVKKISELGHEIGTHSATHPYMSKLNKEAVIKELSSSTKAIENITGKKVELFRAPYGDYNNQLIESAKEEGLFTIQWDVDSLDWKDISAAEIQSRVLKRIKPGSIVLFHNQGLHTADAIKGIIIALKGQGYRIVPIGELIYKDNYSIAPNGEQYLYS